MVKFIRQIVKAPCFIGGAVLLILGAWNWGTGWALVSILLGSTLVGFSGFLWYFDAKYGAPSEIL